MFLKEEQGLYIAWFPSSNWITNILKCWYEFTGNASPISWTKLCLIWTCHHLIFPEETAQVSVSMKKVDWKYYDFDISFLLPSTAKLDPNVEFVSDCKVDPLKESDDSEKYMCNRNRYCTILLTTYWNGTRPWTIFQTLSDTCSKHYSSFITWIFHHSSCFKISAPVTFWSW